jgi:type II restriction/modification system DNA methylase subunit YeeA
MNVAELIEKWRKVELTERSAAQQHFLDLCDLLDHPKPAEVDPKGEFFTFERGATKKDGSDGWADVWKKDYFAWEYKGRHKDLQAAYLQLDQYRAALENPPLLVTCDMNRVVVHTNFTATKQQVHDIPLEELGEPRNLEILRAVFHAPQKLKPGTTSEAITADAASRVGELAVALRERGLDPRDVAHFLDRVVFSFFAEDVGLLPGMVVTRLLEQSRAKPETFPERVRGLFEAMKSGGFFGVDEIRRFNGNLFEAGPILDLTRDEIERLYEAARLDWSAVDPSIFGTLFERGMDPGKRSQLGAHYTSREDIETLVEPVVMKPLRREWREVQQLVANLLATGKKHPKDADREKGAPTGRKLKQARGEAQIFLRRFHQRLSQVHVLDPACGSGNFLYVTLQKLKDLEKEVILFAMEHGFPGEIPLVGPWQLHGIEINPYAFELAQMTVWIGYLQWTRQNGFGTPDDPVLRPMDTFECKDAILDLSDPENPREPEWPKVDFIVGNPPFLGYSKLRAELGHTYTEALFEFYEDRIPNQSDLCCYWFERARTEIESARCRRAGLLATQAIRGGKNRAVLERIRETGDIFFARSDQPWVLDGAHVNVSMVGFDAGIETVKELDTRSVEMIHSDLTATIDVTAARKLPGHSSVSFVGGFTFGSFQVPLVEALDLLHLPNPHGRPNSDVVRPWANGLDILRRPNDMWVIDFGVAMEEAEAAKYEEPFRLIRERVKPERDQMRRESRRERWWLHGETAQRLRAAMAKRPRVLVTPRVAKFRIFRFLGSEYCIDGQLVAFASEGSFLMGLLQSQIHERWALRQGTQLEDRPRYTPTSCFETFPFPEPTEDQREAIAEAAQGLDQLRERWLNPPEWVQEEVLEFPGATDGPWARYVHDPDDRGIGTVRYPRLVPIDATAADKLAQRTLTNLYNQRPTWLQHAHQHLDDAVAAAYGWPPDLTDEQILERLLALNLERA